MKKINENNIYNLNLKKNRYIIKQIKFPLILIVITFAISIFGLTLIPGQTTTGKEYYMSFFDASYFILYTATTIGYGEGLYPLTYSQKIWVIISIILTVVTWFYALSKIISLLQNKDLKAFRKLIYTKLIINNLKTKFIIINSYNELSNKLINKMLKKTKYKIIIIENDVNKIKELQLNYIGEHRIIHLEMPPNLKESILFAGILNDKCKKFVTLNKLHSTNLMAVINARYINEKISIMTLAKKEEEIQDFEIIENINVIKPYELIAEELYLISNNKKKSILINWLRTGNIEKNILNLNINNNFLIIGYGKLGIAIEKKLNKIIDNIKFIDKKYIKNIKQLNAQLTKKINKELSENNYETIFITTSNDYINYLIAKNINKIDKKIRILVKLNKKINEQMFKNINKKILTFNIDEIISNEILLKIANSKIEYFLKIFHKLPEEKINYLYEEITKQQIKPKYIKIEINNKETPTIYKKLKENKKIPIKIYECSITKKDKNNIKTLLLLRKNKIYFIEDIKNKNFNLEFNDILILIYKSNKDKEEIELVSKNIIELNYILNKINK